MRFKKIFSLPTYMICVLSALILSGCAKEGSNNVLDPGTTDDLSVWVHLDGDSTQVFYNDLPSFNIATLKKQMQDENEAIWLEAFIDTSLIPFFIDREENSYDSRYLYAYRIVGDDGFSASFRGYPDNVWEHMFLGYVLILTRRVVFPDELIDLAGAYNVKDVAHIRINRKIDVVAPDTSAFIRLNDLTPEEVTNWDGLPEDAIPLSDIVASVVEFPQNHTYNVEALDGYSLETDLSWTEMQTGYWLLTSERTLFTDPNLQTGIYKVKKLQKIVVKE